MAYIAKRDNGTYQATVYCGRDENGKIIKEYITRKKRKDVVSAAREREQEIADKNAVETGNVRDISLSKWFDEWLSLNKNRITPNTYQLYNLYIETHFKPYFGKKKLGELRELHGRQYIAKRLEKASATTVRKEFSVLRRCIRDALKQRSPFDYIDLPEKQQFKPHVLTDDEFESIVTAYKGHQHQSVILLAGLCGLRRSEIFALNWDDVDFENKTIRVDEARIITDKGYINSERGKSANSLRTVSAPQRVLISLKQHRAATLTIGGLIFKERPDSFSNSFKERIVNAGLPQDVRFHDIRHYHASWLYKNGIPDVYAAQRLGHDMATLKQIYQHLNVNESREIDANVMRLLDNNN